MFQFRLYVESMEKKMYLWWLGLQLELAAVTVNIDIIALLPDLVSLHWGIYR